MTGLLLAVLLAAPVEAPSPPPETEELQHSILAAAAWCVVTSDEEESPGCDLGVGAALIRYRRLSWVVEFDEAGVHVERVFPAVGATLSFARGR